MKTVSTTTGMLLIYIVLANIGVGFPVVFLLFLMTTVLFFWMVFKVLKEPYSTGRTFDTHFYADADFRNG